jgi:hypothetical protein
MSTMDIPASLRVSREHGGAWSGEGAPRPTLVRRAGQESFFKPLPVSM